MKWLPEVWSSMKPFRSKDWMTTRGLTGGSLGILEVQGGYQCVAVSWDRFPMLPEALDIAAYGVFGHFSGFGQGSPIRDAAGQRGYKSSESTFGFRPKDNIEMVACFPHLTNLLYLNLTARSIVRGAWS